MEKGKLWRAKEYEEDPLWFEPIEIFALKKSEYKANDIV